MTPSQARILYATTTHWPHATKLCLALADVGLDVVAIAPKNHALHKVSSISTEYIGRSLRQARASIAAAINRHCPRITIPGDETAIDCLRAIYARAVRGLGSNPWRLTKHIEDSLGAPSSFAFGRQKSRLIHLAKEEGLLTPETEVLRDVSHLRELIADRTFPLVLKCDDGFGGRGVRTVTNRREAEQAFFELRANAGGRGALKQSIRELDVAPLARFWHKAPSITLQSYVNGRPANRAIVCSRGQVLAGLSVEAVRTLYSNGPSTVIRVIDSPEMRVATTRLASRLALSGFVGFDFVLEGSTDRAYLLEMNLRPTGISHLAFDRETDLIRALVMSLTGLSVRRETSADAWRPVALFPLELWRDPASPYLKSACHDVPWRCPEVLDAYRAPVPAESDWLRSMLDRTRDVLRKFAFGSASTGVASGTENGSGNCCDSGLKSQWQRSDGG
jgi:glutathione synthase/RimK-type ligase-like ATP-grasp enzyme